MDIRIIAVGAEKNSLGRDTVAEYTSRILKFSSIEWVFVPSSEAKEEGKRILKAFANAGAGAHLAILDEKGKDLSSEGFAEFIQGRLNSSTRSLVFVIGGAYGFDPAVRARADSVISLSKLTFPHQLVREILAEQIYRAFTILRGDKYHH
jgi:23S rRNA (pseudouridine1915-N3)-methyltransferase